jgi:hypothetical protein
VTVGRTSRRDASYETTAGGSPTFCDFIRSAAVSGAFGSALKMFASEDCVSSDSLDVALTRGGWTMNQLWSRFDAWRQEQRLKAQIGAAS